VKRDQLVVLEPQDHQEGLELLVQQEARETGDSPEPLVQLANKVLRVIAVLPVHRV